MNAICGMTGTFASARDASANLDAMLGALSSTSGAPTATWRDQQSRCRLGIVAGSADDPRPAFFERAGVVAACAGHLFDGGELATADRRLSELWADRGSAALADADAHFALAVWNSREGTLSLARDALGVRSLYYVASADGVVFASSIEALLRHPAVPRQVDVGAVAHFLTFLCVPCPQTLLAGIAKLQPGTVATFKPDGTMRGERYWDLFGRPPEPPRELAYYVDRVRELHRSAVAARVNGGAMAALLSGGNDSSANVALLARLGVGPLHTFTVGLAELEGEDGFSDLVHARRVAKVIGTEHHERLISVNDFIASMSHVIDAQDDLVSEPSSVFLHNALEMVREQRLPVVITGEANDEIACGHGGMVHYRNNYYRRWRPLMALPRPLRRVLAKVVPMLAPRYRDILARAAADGEYFWSFEMGWGDHERRDILTPAALEQARDTPGSAIVAERARAIRANGDRGDYLAHVVGMMMQDHYLGNLMLGKLERLSARLGLDARCPYAAAPYVRFVYDIPAPFKTRDGEVKTFFKAAIDDLLPRDIIYRPKQGFRTPTPQLFRGPFGKWAEPRLLETGLTRTGILRRDTLAGLLGAHRRGERDYSTRLWTALVLNLWHDRWVPAR